MRISLAKVRRRRSPPLMPPMPTSPMRVCSSCEDSRGRASEQSHGPQRQPAQAGCEGDRGPRTDLEHPEFAHDGDDALFALLVRQRRQPQLGLEAQVLAHRQSLVVQILIEIKTRMKRQLIVVMMKAAMVRTPAAARTPSA